MKPKKGFSFENPVRRIREYIKACKYRQTMHAVSRQKLRTISLQDALHVLRHGFHEERKTTFDASFQRWKYAIRGKTFDGVEVRVIVSFDDLEDELVIITVMKV